MFINHQGYAFLTELMLRLEEVATVENAEIRQQLRHLVLPVTSLALSGHQVFALEGKNVKMLQKLGLRDESAC